MEFLHNSHCTVRTTTLPRPRVHQQRQTSCITWSATDLEHLRSSRDPQSVFQTTFSEEKRHIQRKQVHSWVHSKDANGRWSILFTLKLFAMLIDIFMFDCYVDSYVDWLYYYWLSIDGWWISLHWYFILSLENGKWKMDMYGIQSR